MTRTAQGQRSTETFAKLKKYFGFSDQKLADLAGYSLSQVEWRRTGKTPLDVDDLERFGAVFHVPPEVLLLDQDDAVRWVIDNGVQLNVETNNYRRRRPSGLGNSPTGRNLFTAARAADRARRAVSEVPAWRGELAA